jgi:molybdopterin converting factor small subunit
MIEIKLFGSLKKYVGGEKSVELAPDDAKCVNDVLLILQIPKGEVGQILINGTPVNSSRAFYDSITNKDVVDLYPISAGG